LAGPLVATARALEVGVIGGGIVGASIAMHHQERAITRTASHSRDTTTPPRLRTCSFNSSRTSRTAPEVISVKEQPRRDRMLRARQWALVRSQRPCGTRVAGYCSGSGLSSLQATIRAP
jgi:glycine/D-amino acid oxidase-like deaminating enzyme